MHSTSLDFSECFGPKTSPSKLDTPNPNSFSIFYANCRSVLPKLDIHRTKTETKHPSIFALRGTWLSSTISDNELYVPGYSIVRRDRNRKGDGLLIHVRNTLPIVSVTSSDALELVYRHSSMPRYPIPGSSFIDHSPQIWRTLSMQRNPFLRANKNHV